jgi:hypothetical protein
VAPDLCDRVADVGFGGAAGRRDKPQRTCRGDRCGWLYLLRDDGKRLKRVEGQRRTVVQSGGSGHWLSQGEGSWAKVQRLMDPGAVASGLDA